MRQGDLDLQGDYDNALSDFDRVYYRAVQILLITNFATLVLTCTVHVISISGLATNLNHLVETGCNKMNLCHWVA